MKQTPVVAGRSKHFPCVTRFHIALKLLRNTFADKLNFFHLWQTAATSCKSSDLVSAPSALGHSLASRDVFPLSFFQMSNKHQSFCLIREHGESISLKWCSERTRSWPVAKARPQTWSANHSAWIPYTGTFSACTSSWFSWGFRFWV